MAGGTDEHARERARWRALPRGRPKEEDIPRPSPGQESVWDYPRPPRLARDDRRVEVLFGGRLIADSRRTFRVLETASPPVFYIPPEDVARECLVLSRRRTFCEWKGEARYFDVRVGHRQAAAAAWCYPDPDPPFAPIRGYLAFHAGLMDGCRVDGEIVTPQPGAYYGGWITGEILGPFKGEPGTEGW